MTVRGVAQVKIQGKDLASLRAASEMFLDKTEEEVMDIAKATLDGHQRSMIASMKIEEIYKSRHEFSKNVQQSAQTDLIDMGLTLVSYTVQDISDNEGYLDALGQERTVTVRSEARKEIALAKSTSELKNLEIEQEKRENELRYEQSVALKQLDFDSLQAEHLKHKYEYQAKSERAGDLQLAEMNMRILTEELKVTLLEKEKETELMLKKKELKELELANKIERKADFECERERKLAKAYEERTKIEAKAEADKIKRLAKARADTIKLQREADAEVLRERAQAFMQYGNAAKLEMVLAILPRLTAEVAGPMTECKKITSVSQDGSAGFSRITDEVQEIVKGLLDYADVVTGQATSRGNDDDSQGPINPRKVGFRWNIDYN